MFRENGCFFIMLISAFLLLFPAAFAHAQTPAKENLAAMSLEDLMSIQVTSVSKKPHSLSDSAAAVFVITNEELMRSGATSIPDALRMVPGLQVARIDANKWAVSSRGFNSRFTEKLLVLIDGRNLYSPGFSGVYWEAQDMLLEDVERIEVIRGPGATLWGANAVNGVINIITKHSSSTQGGLISAGGGTADQAFGSARYGGALGQGIYGRIYAKYVNRDEFEYQSGKKAGDDWSSFHTGFRMDAKLAGPGNLTLLGDIYTGDLNQRLINVPLPDSPVTEIVEDNASFSGGNLLARWQRILSSDSDFTLQAYYDRTEREDLYAHESRDIFDLDFQHRFAATERHDMVWGLRYRYTYGKYTDQYISIVDPASQGDQLFSAFLQDEISIINNKLWLILGSKFEHNDYSGFEIQPSGRLLWTPHAEHRFWAAVSRAVRTPSRAERDARIQAAVIPAAPPFMPLPVKVVIEGNPSFDSEEVMAYEAGYRFIPGDEVSLDVALFYNEYDKLRLYSATDPVLKNGYLEVTSLTENEGEGTLYGVEVSAAWQPASWLKTDLAYSFLHTDVTATVIGGDAPKHQVSWRTTLQPLDHLDFDLWLRYVDKTITNYITARGFGIYEIDDYLTLDFRLAWQLGEDIELIVAGQNLLDEGHVEFVQEVYTAPTEIPRRFYGQIKYTF